MGRVVAPKLLERTLLVLANFTAEDPEWTVTSIGRVCKLSNATVQRILATLQTYGYVVRDVTTKRFRLGPAARALGRACHVMPVWHSAGIPTLKLLAEQTGETAILTLPTEDRLRATCIESVASSQALRLVVPPGRSFPLHAGAQQKVILAFMSDEDQQRIVEGPLEKLSQSTIVESEKLWQELRVIRGRGWARSRDETNLGTWGLAMALLDRHGDAVASLGIAGPQVRFQRKAMTERTELLASAAADLAEKLDLLPSRLARPRRRPKVGSCDGLVGA